MSARTLALALVMLAAVGCEREERRFTEAAPASGLPRTIRLSELQPGGNTPSMPMRSAYDENAWAVSEGQHYYEAFNCVGCHSHGGGGMGPPLMDREWIYGSEPENIFATIVEGRPNGMPSFRGRIPNQQLWQLVAYVRSLGGLTPKDVRPQRSDDLFGSAPPGTTPSQTPTSGRRSQ